MVRDALRQLFDEQPLPPDKSAFITSFETGLNTRRGHTLNSTPDICPVCWIRNGDGGMSNGSISGPFWRDAALPLLRRRNREARIA